MPEASDKLTTTCAIAGAGPAGLMLGVLLARAGVDVVVLEKHADFLRDFRGDTIHPSTLEVMAELGWLDDLLALPHQKVHRLVAQFGSERLQLADLTRLPVRAPYVAMMPQWDFLNFLAEKGRGYAPFRLLMRTEAQGLIERDGRIAGLRAATPEGPLEVRARLTVAADGRQSVLRAASGLPVDDYGAPMDALWFALPREPTDTDETQGRFDAGRIFVMLNRGDYWQCAFVIPKGADAEVRTAGLAAFREALRLLLPIAPSRADAIRDWDQVKLLAVQVNRLRRWWRPGFLAIGDAAHAMSPIGGVGINLAIQDAVAAANRLAVPLAGATLADHHLAAIERRRRFPTRATQRLQLILQNTVIAPALATRGPLRPPLAARLIGAVPVLARLPARLLGLGIRPEHVATPEVRRAQPFAVRQGSQSRIIW
jgi:2-polyprenyl-6-methoxyphenol hydroxylase-like FAD-dependent oxidoreductase